MAELIDATYIRTIRPISSNISDTTKIDPYIPEAREFDLKPVLDCQDELFYDEVVAGEGDGSIYDALILYIKPVLAYYSFARFLRFLGLNVTAYGAVVKLNEFSEPLNERSLARFITQTESAALAYQGKLIQFLIDNRTTYPNWKCSSESGRQKSGARISAIGGNQSSDADYCPEEGLHIL